MHYTYLEDLVNNAYEELIIAFEGGNSTHYNNPVYKDAKYGTEDYYKKFKNIGAFVMYITGSSVSKYRSKTFRKQVLHEDTDQDIGDKLNYTDFEINNNLDYTLKEPDEGNIFPLFKVNKEFAKHLFMLKETHPRNNILYNYILWSSHDA